MTEPPRPTPRHSASLIVLRDGVDGLEVLMLRRAEREGDQNSGAAVFPGGHLDARRRARAPAVHRLDRCTGQRARWRAEAGGLNYWIAALRECFEESGLLLAVDSQGRWADLRTLGDADTVMALRQRLNDGEVDIASSLRAARLAAGHRPRDVLQPLAHAAGAAQALRHALLRRRGAAGAACERRRDRVGRADVAEARRCAGARARAEAACW